MFANESGSYASALQIWSAVAKLPLSRTNPACHYQRPANSEPVRQRKRKLRFSTPNLECGSKATAFAHQPSQPSPKACTLRTCSPTKAEATLQHSKSNQPIQTNDSRRSLPRPLATRRNIWLPLTAGLAIDSSPTRFSATKLNLLGSAAKTYIEPASFAQ